MPPRSGVHAAWIRSVFTGILKEAEVSISSDRFSAYSEEAKGEMMGKGKEVFQVLGRIPKEDN